METALSMVTEHGVVTATGDAPSLTFGRAPETNMRIGHAPFLDMSVARCAGMAHVVRDRLLITNLGEALAFAVVAPDCPLVDVRPGETYGPNGDRCEIILEGALRYMLRVLVERAAERRAVDAGTYSGPRTAVVLPELTDRQRLLLDLYTEPLRRAGTSPRSHRQVAEAAGVSYSLARVELNSIWLAFDRAGVPMRPHGNKVDEVIETWLRHRLDGA